SGGFPCQDINIAGKGAGINGERSGLWREFARIVREVRPRYVFVENSPLLVKRGLTRVLRDLAEAGYDAAWTVLGADDVGAPHRRKRLWVLGKISDPASIGRETFGDKNGITPETLHQASAGQPCRADCDVSDSAHERNVRRNGQHGADEEAANAGRDNRRGTQEDDRRKWWSIEPGLGRVADGVPNRVDRLKAIGNAQVPLVAATAFKLLFKQLNQPTR
ncbi:MAG: DNA cytosine methyltransferase, partial [Opitutales bacterium]|nr:DNA cytosine methyltransferase [Opitutales bacterium]